MSQWLRKSPPLTLFELLSHMKGGPSVEVLLDLALGEDDGSLHKQALKF